MHLVHFGRSLPHCQLWYALSLSLCHGHPEKNEFQPLDFVFGFQLIYMWVPFTHSRV